MGDVAQSIRAPEGVELDIVVYLTSDAENVDVRLVVGGLPLLSPFLPNFDPLALLGGDAAPLREAASDWRPMTRAEIADYKRRQDEEPGDA